MTAARFALFFSLWLGASLGEEPKVHGVCEVLEQLQDFTCRLIRLKGLLISDVDTWVQGEKCPRPFEIQGVTFHHFIHLNSPANRPFGCNVDFQNDEESLHRMRDALRRWDRKNEKIYVLLDGIIETRKPPDALVTKEPFRRLGFGHLGGAPAQIIVKRVISVEVRRAP